MIRHEIRWVYAMDLPIGVVERVVCETGNEHGCCWYVSSRTPIAVLCQREGEDVALGIDGRPLDLAVVTLLTCASPSESNTSSGVRGIRTMRAPA